MNASDFPEIEALDQFILRLRAEFHHNTKSPTAYGLVRGTLILSEKIYAVYINDEYHDLDLPDKRISIVLALREFELIEESTDYLHWCKMQQIPALSEEIRSYYQLTVKRIPELKSNFNSGTLTSFISDLDFQINAGAMQWLRSRPV